MDNDRATETVRILTIIVRVVPIRARLVDLGLSFSVLVHTREDKISRLLDLR